jgi:hypothetical protein
MSIFAKLGRRSKGDGHRRVLVISRSLGRWAAVRALIDAAGGLRHTL